MTFSCLAYSCFKNQIETFQFKNILNVQFSNYTSRSVTTLIQKGLNTTFQNPASPITSALGSNVSWLVDGPYYIQSTFQARKPLYVAKTIAEPLGYDTFNLYWTRPWWIALNDVAHAWHAFIVIIQYDWAPCTLWTTHNAPMIAQNCNAKALGRQVVV